MLYTPCDKKNYHKNVDANVARFERSSGYLSSRKSNFVKNINEYV